MRNPAKPLISFFFAILLTALPFTDPGQTAHSAEHSGTLAVLNFDTDGGAKDLGVVISEIIRSEIASLADLPFIVVDRVMLDRVMKEHELAMTGVVDNAGASKMGKVLFADHLVVGKILSLGKEIRINARIIETNTAAIKKEATETVYTRDDLSGAARAVAYRLFGKTYSYRKTVLPGGAVEEIPAAAKPPASNPLNGSYTSIYTDGRGIHRGGTIHLTVTGDRVTGYTIEDIGRAEMTGILSDGRIIGYYRGKYGYGNFTFRLVEGGKYLDGDYYQVSNGAHGDWLASRDSSFTMPKELFSGKWPRGSRCLSRWSGDAYWYPATVDDVKDGLYHVNYDDGDAEWRLEKHIRELRLKRGDRVFGNWQGKGRYYRGVIGDIKGEKLFIQYDDGDQEWTTAAKIRLMLEQ